MIYVIFLHAICLFVFIKDRYITFVSIILFVMTCMSMLRVPNLAKGDNFHSHYDLAALFLNFYTMM